MAAALSILALGWTTGCAGFWVNPGSSNGNNSNSSSGDIVYVANASPSADSGSLIGFTVASGSLTQVTGSTYSLTFIPQAMAITPNNSYLYVAGSNSEIYCFTLNSDGSIATVIGVADLTSPFVPVVAMDISPDGQWLVGLAADNQSLYEFQITSSTGALLLINKITYPVTSGATAIARQVKFAPNGNYLFAALDTAGFVAYTFDTSSSSGALTNPQTPLSWSSIASANALAVSPNSEYLYIAISSGTTGSLAAYSIGSSGPNVTLTEVGLPAAAGTQPYSVAVNTAGTDVYVANRGSNSISGFSIGSGGTLTQLNMSPYTSDTGVNVTALAVDNSGKYLLSVANGGSPDLTQYSYDSSGNLVLPTSASTGSGTEPAGAIALATTH
jgi:6-phosphogluconolactonase (cycloisomerase 2 family)